mgnify:CR=1 FL=1
MKASLHSIELEQGGNVVATFRNEKEYDDYLGSLAVDYYDGDYDALDALESLKVWYCVFIGGSITSLTEQQYKDL